MFNEDNLVLLKRLPDECIDLIYCDILYNTGKKFRDYDDNLGTPREAIDWYKPRLTEMKRVLKSSGSIYLQCDYRLVHYLKVFMDELFGYNNFKNDIRWRYSVAYKSEGFPHDTDDILFYSKTNNYYYEQQYRMSDKSDKRYMKDFKNGKWYFHQGRNLKDSPWKLKIRDEKFVKENNLQDYFYEKEYIGVRVSEVWDDIGIVARCHNSVGYDTQKPNKLLERIILSSSKEGDLVADFFCGSGTTCVVAKELGRNYLGCDIGKKAIEISKQRIEKIR